jgi:hypothetical protein
VFGRLQQLAEKQVKNVFPVEWSGPGTSFANVLVIAVSVEPFDDWQ